MCKFNVYENLISRKIREYKLLMEVNQAIDSDYKRESYVETAAKYYALVQLSDLIKNATEPMEK